MTSNMLDIRAGTKRRGALLLRGLAFALVLGASLGGLFGFVFGARPLSALVGALSGMLNVSVMTLVIVGGEIFFPRTRLGRALEAAPFVMTVAIKALIYGAVITLVFGGSMGRRIVGAVLLTPDAAAEALQGAMPRAVAIGIAFSLSLSFILVLQLGRLIGEQTLLDIVLGRYHRPRAEERFFLFVDIVGSTPLAERIGPAAVHRFLGEVFRLASDPIDDHHGEVHQYVGDEIVVTWKAAEGRDGARPLACLFAIERALENAASSIEREFGVVPRLRAALHAGLVITGEVGVTRRAIVHHGDVMNTTSRIEQATRDLGRQFLVSADALERLADLDGFVLEDLGPQRLRGRTEPIQVYGVALKAGIQEVTPGRPGT